MRIELGPERAAQKADLAHQLFGSRYAAGHEVAVPAGIFRERINREVRAVPERLLVHRPEQRVVHHHRRPIALFRADLVGRLSDRPEIDQAVRWIGRRLQHDQADAPFRQRLPHGRRDLAAVDPIRESHRRDSESRELIADQRLGATIERPAVQDRVARAQEGEQHRRDRRHAAREDGRAAGFIPDRKPIFQNLEIWIVEARVDQPGFLARPRRPPPRGHIEEVLALLSRLEDEG